MINLQLQKLTQLLFLPEGTPEEEITNLLASLGLSPNSSAFELKKVLSEVGKTFQQSRINDLSEISHIEQLITKEATRSDLDNLLMNEILEIKKLDQDLIQDFGEQNFYDFFQDEEIEEIEEIQSITA
ncbi:MAG: hypothetical protein ACI86H_003086 [bacterium]|jgi:hypothetical protein